MSLPVRMSVDCMGGDIGPSATLPACLAFARAHEDVELLLVGQPEVLARHGASRIPRSRVVAATEVVAMDDPVEVALRKKKDSSMRVAISQLKPVSGAGGGQAPAAQACVSAGNTGALMALSKYLLKTVPGIDRPAIASFMPHVKGGSSVVLDLGANVDCEPEHLLQFAVMGSALAAAVQGRDNASVGLLNVGEEVIKGSEVIKKAAELLRSAANAGEINFYGNVEGNDIFKGTTDVVVCDGFVGNVALKTAEGLAYMLSHFLRDSFSSSIFTKVTGFIALKALKAFKSKVDHRRYNGAALLGLNGLVFKSHGSADAYAFEQALMRAYDAARHDLHHRVQQRMAVSLSRMQLSSPAP